MMSTRSRLCMVSALVTVSLSVAGCGSASSSSASSSSASSSSASGSSGGNTTITVALTPASTVACLKVSGERGIFTKHGVTVTFTAAPPTGAAIIAQILNGQVTAGVGGYTSVITAVSRGLPVMITNATDHDYDQGGQTGYATIVGKGSDVTSFKQLEGKTVAVNSLGGNWQVALSEAVVKDGGDPSKVKTIAIPFPQQITALKAGRVDAISTLPPFIGQLTSQGYRSIGDPQAISLGTKDSASGVVFMAKSYVEANSDAVKSFVAAQQEGNLWCNAHPTEIRKAIVDITKVPQDIIDKTPLATFNDDRPDGDGRLVQAPPEVQGHHEGSGGRRSRVAGCDLLRGCRDAANSLFEGSVGNQAGGDPA